MKIVFKGNYNQFIIKPTDIPSVLTAFFNTTGWQNNFNGKKVLERLMRTNWDAGNSKKVMLDNNVHLRLVNVDGGFDSVYAIGMDDGMPESVALEVYTKLRNLEIDFKLNGELIENVLYYDTEERGNYHNDLAGVMISMVDAVKMEGK